MDLLPRHVLIRALLLAGLLVLAIGCFILGDLVMRLIRRTLTAAAAAAAAMGLSACNPAALAAFGGAGKAVLGDLQNCKRHYTGTFGATGFNGSADIACDPVVQVGSVIAPAASPAGPPASP